MRLLIIDDSVDDGMFFCRLARRNGAEMEHLTDWRNVEETLAAEPFDCVLVDYRLGPDDGLEVIRRLIESNPDLAVVAVTGQGSEHVAVQALHSGAKDYLVKGSVTVESLARCVSNAVEKTRLEAEVKAQRRDLESFSSVIGHDLQQPLCSIKGNVEVLAEFFVDQSSEQGQEFAAAAIRTVARMDELLLKLLNYCRANTVEALEDVELSRVLKLTIENLNAAIRESGTAIHVGALPAVQGNEPLLIQLFQNLISNAIRYSNAEQPTIRIDAEQEGPLLRVRVADNGPGIPPDKLESIFQPFTRAVHEGKMGFGLGLATCRRIAERIGATIRAHNVPDGGAEFIVQMLPASSAADAADKSLQAVERGS